MIHLVVCHGESRHAGASSKQASETQRRHTSARSRNERARGVLFASKPTRRCGSSAEAAMAAIKRPRETRNGRFWMLIELKKAASGRVMQLAGNQTPFTATKPRNARDLSGSAPFLYTARVMFCSLRYSVPANRSHTRAGGGGRVGRGVTRAMSTFFLSTLCVGH